MTTAESRTKADGALVSTSEFGMVLDANGLDVIEGCRRGDPDAFGALFELHKDKVYSIALRYSGDPAAAMDIAQDTFLKLLSTIRKFRGDSTFDSWLYRMVVNSCLDYRRRRKRLIPLVEQWIDSLWTTRETVLNDLLRVELENSVQQVVGQLTPEHRMVVILRYTEGLSYEEIAVILGCSKGTVASRLNRAHKILERRLSH